MSTTTQWRTRNPNKHEYEVMRASKESPMIYVGAVEASAVRNAAHMLAEGPWAGEEKLRIYHSYPGDGPLRRYMGTVTADGKLHRVT